MTQHDFVITCGSISGSTIAHRLIIVTVIAIEARHFYPGAARVIVLRDWNVGTYLLVLKSTPQLAWVTKIKTSSGRSRTGGGSVVNWPVLLRVGKQEHALWEDVGNLR